MKVWRLVSKCAPKGTEAISPQRLSAASEGSLAEAGNHARQYSLHLGFQVVDGLLVQVAAEERKKVAGQEDRLRQ